jgi:hypothetical protein
MVASCEGSQQALEINSKIAPFFSKVRENALDMHVVLKNGWHCCCTNTHKVMLQLERRVNNRELEFGILLAVPSAPAMPTITTTTSAIYIQQETRIKVSSIGVEIEDDEGQEDFPATLQDSSVSCGNSD